MRIFFVSILALVVLTGCSATSESKSAPAAAIPAAAVSQEKGGQEEFGPYELVENWPQPLADGPDGVKHDGWTWGSVGAVFAETPDRIWIAQRGELPLPPGAKPWTAYGMLTPPRTAIPANMANVAPRGSWLSTTVQADPFQRSMRVPTPFPR